MMGKNLFADRRTPQSDHRHRPCSGHERNRGRAGHMPGTCGTRARQSSARSAPSPQPLPERFRGSAAQLHRGANSRVCGAGIRRRQSLAGPRGRGATKESNSHAMCGRDPGRADTRQVGAEDRSGNALSLRAGTVVIGTRVRPARWEMSRVSVEPAATGSRPTPLSVTSTDH